MLKYFKSPICSDFVTTDNIYYNICIKIVLINEASKMKTDYRKRASSAY